jgi:hypothetical protein
MRDGGGAGARHALVDCGPHGVMNFGHAHADVLSLTASAGGRPLLVDSGTYSYPGPERNAFRGAAAHNVLLVDGVGSSEPAAGAFQWARVAHGRPLAWDVGEDYAFFEGTHDGFAHLPDPVSHRRAVLFLTGLGWVVRDRLDARGEHTVRLHWHLAPGLTPVPRDGAPGTVVVDTDGRPALVVVAAVAGRELALTAEPSPVSPRYGARVEATRLVAEARVAAAEELLTVLGVAAAGPRPAADIDRARALCERFFTPAEADRLTALLGGGGPA